MPPTSSFHVDNIPDGDRERLARLVDALDRQAGMPGVLRLRAWAREALAVRAGERVLDVGTGTGDEVVAFARVGADAVGVEPNPGLRAVAEGRAAGTGARFVDGRASALPFDDGSVDAVRCERVFQHLSDPEGAAAEIARVLRPGGRVVLVDTDWPTLVVHPGDEAVVAALRESTVVGKPQPLAGRKLAGWLAGAGLAVTDIGSQALVRRDAVEAEPLVRMMVAGAVARRALGAEQGERLVADLLRAGEAGDFHMSVTMFAVFARKAG